MKIAYALAMLLLFAGCGAAGKPSASGPDNRGGHAPHSYESAAALRTGLEAAGFDCTQWLPFNNEGGGGQGGMCGAGHGKIELFVYPNPGGLERAIASTKTRLEELAAQGNPIPPVFVGPNWELVGYPVAPYGAALGGRRIPVLAASKAAGQQPPECAVLTESRAAAILAGPVFRLEPTLPANVEFCGWQGKQTAEAALNQVKLTVTPVGSPGVPTPADMPDNCDTQYEGVQMNQLPAVAPDAAECIQSDPHSDEIVWTAAGQVYNLALYTLYALPEGTGAQLALEMVRTHR